MSIPWSRWPIFRLSLQRIAGRRSISRLAIRPFNDITTQTMLLLYSTYDWCVLELGVGWTDEIRHRHSRVTSWSRMFCMTCSNPSRRGALNLVPQMGSKRTKVMTSYISMRKGKARAPGNSGCSQGKTRVRSVVDEIFFKVKSQYEICHIQLLGFRRLQTRTRALPLDSAEDFRLQDYVLHSALSTFLAAPVPDTILWSRDVAKHDTVACLVLATKYNHS